MKHRTLTTLFGCLLACLLTVPAALAQDERVPLKKTLTWEVTITNVTANQIIGPPVVATHNFRANIFRAGEAPSDVLAAIAEDADSASLIAALEDSNNVLDVVAAGGPLLPGDSVTLTVTTNNNFQRLSTVGMLVTTNDTFFGVDSFILHGGNRRMHTSAPGYDAGSEANDDLCESIPGPPCGNPFVRVTEGAEGFVHINPGITGRGDLDPAELSWLNPVVNVRFERQ
jgi:hypothetical protein